MDGSLLLIFGTSLLVGYSGALMPGPLLAVTVSESARRGFWVGPLLVAGHGGAEVVLLGALALGLSRLLTLGLVRGGIAILGGLVLVFMGLRIAGAMRHHDLSLANALARPSEQAKRNLLAGATVSVSNPYWIIWWSTIGAGYVVWALDSGPLGLVSFYIGHILSDLTWYSFIAGAVARGGRLLSDKAYRGVLGLCAVFLVVLGIYFVAKGIGHSIS